MTHLIGVYGASGFGRETMPIIKRANEQGSNCKFVFVDDVKKGEVSNGYAIIGWEAFLDIKASKKSICLAIAASDLRENLFNKCRIAGVEQIEARAQNVIQLDNVDIAEGAILSPFVTVTSNVRIGRCFHANIYSYVAHDCIIGDFVTFAPAVKCNGNIHIDDHAYIGTGAILRQGKPSEPLRIGKGAIVGMGAVVTRHVAPGVTVIGNPARPMEKS